MSTGEKKKKKERKQQLILLKEEEMKEKEEYVDIQVCPICKSARVKRVGTMKGDMSGHLAVTPIKYECPDCGWRRRLVIKASNKPLSLKEIAIIAEALDLKAK